MSRVAANGVDFHVQDIGAGPPVVMVHGLLIGSLASWYFTAAPALARTHHVRLYDLRGHGRSEATTTGYDLATMVRDLDALTADLDAFDLVGHSWGGLVALRFAMAHPERVRRLAVVEAPLPPSRFAEIDGFLDPDPQRLMGALPPSLRDALAGNRRQARRLAEALLFLTRDSSLLHDLRVEPDLADADLARLDVPLLCAYGDRSACLSAGERLARVVPAARLEVLSGGHYLHLDATGPLTAALQSHLG